MPTIKSVELNTNGSLQLITDGDMVINISPRILLDASLTYTPPVEVEGGPSNADLTNAALLNLCADLTDRITHQEARLSELVNFIRQLASALPKPAETATTQPDTSTVPPTSVPSAVKPEPVAFNPERINSEPDYSAPVSEGPRIVQVTGLTPK
jgi:hypothetical protein